MNIDQAAQGFTAAGSGPRLEVLLTLVRAGPGGLKVGELQQKLDIPASTLAHHLRILCEGRLVEQEKQGRSVVNRASFETIQELAGYLLKKCCADHDGSVPESCSPGIESSPGKPE
jgi:ArsR family transcriptional regulator